MMWKIITNEDCVNNINRGLDNCRYHAKTEFNNCFIMYLNQKTKNYANEHEKIACQVNSYNIF